MSTVTPRRFTPRPKCAGPNCDERDRRWRDLLRECGVRLQHEIADFSRFKCAVRVPLALVGRRRFDGDAGERPSHNLHHHSRRHCPFVPESEIVDLCTRPERGVVPENEVGQRDYRSCLDGSALDHDLDALRVLPNGHGVVTRRIRARQYRVFFVAFREDRPLRSTPSSDI